jgi:multidrug efflux pump subunit AcrB
MISAVFVDRPRLAIVIAFVITIAGALALMQIPVAQFPDIVPPQVTVTAVFPGASAEVVESSVAQPLEAQVVGVDKMLYMKSTSGNDGSYTLTVSFALGTNPDINTVNVSTSTTACRPRCRNCRPRCRRKGSSYRRSLRPCCSSSCSTARTASRIRCSSPTTL